jgi:Tol biopolymer transport system component
MLKSDGRRRATTIVAGLMLAALFTVLLVLWGERPAEAAFPGANGLIAYEVDCCFFGPGIEAVDVDPSTPSWEWDRITLSEDSDSDPAWSPDGQQIAFSRWNPDGGREEIYVMDADPSTDDAIRLTNNSAYDTEPAWSADGQHIAFESDRDGDYEIYVMDTDPATDDAVKLTNNNVDDREPVWSTDGELAFTRDRDGRLRSWSDREIYVMDPDPATEGVTRITKNNTADEYPDWSPNGRKIVFVGNSEGKRGIMVMNKDGSRRTAVLRRGGYEPVWSPDGTKIAYTRLIYVGDPGYEDHIYVMNKDGSGEQGIAFGDDSSPSWQPIVP